MAKAMLEAQSSPNDEPNQQQTSQNYQFPQPRGELSSNTAILINSDFIALFPEHINEEDKAQAEAYIETQLQNRTEATSFAFLLGLLEKAHAIPSELAVEERSTRAERIEAMQQLLIDFQKYIDANGRFQVTTFTEEVIDVVGRDKIMSDPIIQLIRSGLRQVSKNTHIESELMTAQRIALLGIAKQITP